MKYAICNETFEGWELPLIFEVCGRLGYEGVELAPFTICERVTDVSRQERRRIRDEAAQRALEIPGLHWLLARTQGLHLTSPDAAVRDETADYLVELIEFGFDLGATRLVFGSPAQRNLLPGVDPRDAWDWSRAVFFRCAEAAADRGLIFCLEALPPPESNLFTTVDDCLRMVGEIGHPGFSTMLDVKSMASEPRPIPETIARAVHAARYVHANDANRREPGSGDTDFVPIFRALRGGGYDGWMSVEVFDYSTGGLNIARNAIAYLRGAEASSHG